MMEKYLASASRHLQRILGYDNTREMKPIQPSSSVCGGRTFGKVDFQPTALCREATIRHLLIYPTPKRFECTERRKGQHQLASRLEMFHQSLNSFEPVRAEKHDREITGDAVETGHVLRQCTHIQGFEPKPWKLHSLDRACALDLMPTEIDGQNLPRRPHLLCQIEGRNTMAARNIEYDGSRAKIQMLQQRFSEGS